MLTRSTSEAKGVFFVKVLRISPRSEAEGSPTNNWWSRRPGRIIAGSIMSGRFVAATTYTPFLSLRPSSSVNSVLTIREDASV